MTHRILVLPPLLLVAALGACAQRPVALIPDTVRLLMEAEDQAGAPHRPITVDAMLARVRKEVPSAAAPPPVPPEEPPPGPQDMPARARAWRPPAPQVPVLAVAQADNGQAMAGMTARSRPKSDAQSNAKPIVKSDEPPVTVRFAPHSADIAPEDRLRVQAAVTRLSPGPHRALMRFSPGSTGDGFSRLSLGHRRADAVQGMLPAELPSGDTLYDPEGEPDTVIIEFPPAADRHE